MWPEAYEERLKGRIAGREPREDCVGADFAVLHGFWADLRHLN